jgi:hypothetical protein
VIQSAELRPVFIGGCSRSGTTHLGAILGAHPECVCVPESGFKTEALRSDQPKMAILAAADFRRWGLDGAALRRDMETSRWTYPQALQHIIRRYAQTVGRGGARVWIDHAPLNVRHGVTLLEMFPTATFIHLVRDGRAVAASVLPLDWGPNTIERAAHWWAEELAFGLGLEAWGGTRVLRVAYEALVLDPETTVRAIAASCDLTYEPRMLRGDGFTPLRHLASEHVLVGRASEPARAGAWKSVLTQREVEIFESVAGDLLAYLGYQPRFGSRARRTSRAERALFALREFCRDRLVNRPHFRRRAARALRASKDPGPT